MLYSIIEKKKGEKNGLLPNVHRLAKGGELMVVNENELRLIDSDINVAAQKLGGVVMSKGEVLNKLNKYKK